VDRVQIGAIALAVLLIVASVLFGGSPRPSGAPGGLAAPQKEASPAPAGAAIESSDPAITPLSGATAAERRTVVLENDSLRIEVSNIGGRLQRVELPVFRSRVGPDAGPVELVTDPNVGTLVVSLGSGVFERLESVPSDVVRAEPREVVLRSERAGVVVTRTLAIDPTGYGLQLAVGVENRGSEIVMPRFDLSWFGHDRPADAPDAFPAYSVVVSGDGGITRTPVQGIGKPGFVGRLFGSSGATGEWTEAPVDWVGLDSRYFLLGSIAENPREASAFAGPFGAEDAVGRLVYPAFELPPGTSVRRTYRIYAGPKTLEEMRAVDPRFEQARDVGWAWIRPLVDLFGAILAWTHAHLISNYGVAIILLTILLRILTFPLTQRSMKSMKRFGEIAPEMKAIQDKYANDKGKLQEELMALYRRKGMNPLAAMGGGCIPMLIQMPFMVALYFALQSSIELRHAPFLLWIRDLSAPDRLFEVAGIPVRVLPLLMGASMVIQQRLTPSPNADPQQKQMMTLMSVMFIFLFYQFPSGLVLYWFVSNVLGIAQQLYVNRPGGGAPAGARA
jgi:YidC/Oxa1 family membrane protein insertase